MNVDFLKNEEIIPNKPPFDKMTNFVSTPPVSTIKFGPIEIVVEDQRFQIRETGLDLWHETVIFDVAVKYFDILKYTPVTTAGINFNGQISFDNVDEAERFQKLLLPEKSKIIDIISSDDIDISLRIKYPYEDRGFVLLTIDRSVPGKLQKNFSFNYEFTCFENSKTDWSVFKDELTKITSLSEYCTDIFNQLTEAV